MKKRHILVVSQYFFPEQFRINDICTEWVNRGYEVTVLTGIPNYPEGKYYTGYGLFSKRKESYNGMNIIRIPLIPRGKNKCMLAANYASFVVSGLFWKIFTRLKADLVFIFEVSPMTQALPGVWYSKKRKIPCFLYVQDLWPENVEIITGTKNKKLLKIIEKMVIYIYERVTKIFVVSNSFKDAIVKRGIPGSKIKFWPQYAEDFYIPQATDVVPEIPENNKLNVLFAGNIGAAQGLEILVDAAVELKNQKRSVLFNLVGDGRYKSELIKQVDEKQVSEYFNFIDKKPAEKIPRFIARCDVSFLSLKESKLFEMTIPAKLQSYMACGSPVLVSAAGETASIITESKCGFCSPPGNAELLVKNIEKMISMPKSELNKLGNNAREYYLQNFNKEKLLNEIDDCFMEIGKR